MNTTTRNEVLASIDAMNEVVQESELSVLSSLVDQMDKASVILENYNGADLEAFAIYQEADEASSVQQGDPSGDANAEAKKKNIFVKVWEFIKNLLGSIGNFIKRCWNGTVVPAAETVSDKTADIINKIAGKDENWIKEHGAEIGLTTGGIAAAIAILAIIKKDSIKKAIDTFVAKLKLFFTNFKGLITFDFTGAGIKTNIKFDSVVNVIKSSVKIFNGAKNLASNNMTVDQLVNELTQLQNVGDTIVQEEREFAFSEVLKQIEPIRLEFINANISGDGNPGDIKVNDADENKAKLAGSLLSKLGGAFVAISAFFKSMLDKVSGLLSKSEDLGGGSNNQGDTNDQNPTGDTENAGDTGSLDTPDSAEQPDVSNVADGSGSDETNTDEASTETFDQMSLTKGQKLTTDEAEKILKQLGVIGDDKHLNEKITYQPLSSTNKKVFTDSNNQQYKGLKKVKTDDNTIAWVVEYSDEEISEDEDVVTESHSPYYW